MAAIQPDLYPLEVSLHRIRKPWGGWPGGVGEIWSLAGPPHESLVLNGPLAGRWLTEIVGSYQQRLLGEGMEMDPREPFPFLMKFVLAARNLPVHVHPNDAFTLEKRLPAVGVDKVWVILDSEPEARLYLGLQDVLSPAALKEALKDGTLPLRLNALSVSPGDVYTVPAGRAHAIGKGVKLLEVQRHSGAAYDLQDRAGKHGGTPEAFEALDPNPVAPRPIPKIPVPMGESRVEYVACTPRFLLRRLVIKGTLEIAHAGKRMAAYTGLKGAGWLRWGFSDLTTYIQPYQTVLVPAVEQDLCFESDGVLEVMETSVPDMAGEIFGPILRLGIPMERIAMLGGDDYGRILRDSLCRD
jgi:mannose-6-phosphate isomerase